MKLTLVPPVPHQPGTAQTDLGQVLDKAQWTRHQLRAVYGVTLTSSDRTTGPVAQWNPGTRTVAFRADASATDMAWAIEQVWLLITVGPHAATGYRPIPTTPTLWRARGARRLTVVPR